MKITRIEPQKKTPLRENIFLDGEFGFGISTELRFLSKLQVDQELSKKEATTLIEKDQIDRLVNKAIKFLSFRPRSQKEITGQLLFKGKLSELQSETEKKQYQTSVQKAVDFLVTKGLLNDTEFAAWWVEQRRQFKKIGDRVIKSELYTKGVDREIIDQVMGEKSDPYALALAAGEKKLASYYRYEPREFKTKMGQYLVRHGFDWEVISRVVDTLLAKR